MNIVLPGLLKVCVMSLYLYSSILLTMVSYLRLMILKGNERNMFLFLNKKVQLWKDMCSDREIWKSSVFTNT